MEDPAFDGFDPSPEDALATRAAWLYYAGGMTQAEVASALGVSPLKAHRLIARAGRIGAVRVFVEGPIADCLPLERHLAREFGLNFCRVVPTLPPASLPLRSLGLAAAAVLLNVLEAGEHRIIGMGHGRTLAAAIDHLPRLPRPDLRFVSLLGGVPRKMSANPFDVIHRLAEKTGAEAYLLPVPFFANSAEDRAVLLAQRGVAEAIALARQSTLCLVGIGEVDGAEAFLRQSGMISPEEQLALAAAGAVGEVLGCFLDAEGRPIATPLHERLIALPFLDLAGREVYGVAGGSAKVAAIAAVLRARILTGLITDELTARRLLDGGYSSRHPHNEDRGSETWTERPGTSPAA